jgi:heterodisulfide reductase subunit A2
VANEFNMSLDNCKAIYRPYPQAVPQAFTVKKLDRAPCVRACPANINVQGFVQLIKAKKYPEALSLIMEKLPLPGAISRTCPHPCETDCRRQEVDEPISICNLERFVADNVDWNALPVPEVPRKNEKVAIIGAGPAGLSCAYYLALKGFQAVIFEAASEAGGWLRNGVPADRLPREILDQEVDYIRRCGVEIRYNTPIGGETTINDLLTRDGFSAVFVGVGAQTPDLKFISETDGITLTPEGRIATDPETKATSRAGVFAGGGVETGPGMAIAAVAAGREAAISIDRFVMGQDLKADREVPVRPLSKEAGQWNPIPEDIQKQPQTPVSTPAAVEGGKEFHETNQGYTEEQALEEAARCLNCGVCSECGLCATVCQSEAVDLGQKAQTVDLNVGAVILALGFKTYNPQGLENYGYGVYPNVYTSLEFERILSPGGPLVGRVVRRSDRKAPKKIAWLQCVGMRSNQEAEYPYCSNFCCMAALKQTMIARERLGPDLDTALFYLDMRTPRKDFEKYLMHSEEQEARLIRSREYRVTQVGEEGDLMVRYVTETGEVHEEIFDMVVLSVGGVITPETITLAEKLGVNLSDNRFMDTNCFAPVTTSRPGIFSCGFFNGPKDITQSVMEGNAAAGAAASLIASARDTLIEEKVYPPEVDVAAEPVRVGVFVCYCGTNIGGVIDVPALVEYAKTIPDVAYAQANLFSCSQNTQREMVEIIKEHKLNRVVLGACSPPLNEATFQDMLRTAGLNKYLFEMANIRNHCTWVHQAFPEAAQEKCQDLIRMAVARVRLLQPLEYLAAPVDKTGLVVGGGLSGLTSALTLAGQGFQVHLVERQGRLGGHARQLHTTWRGELVASRLENVIDKVTSHPNIAVHLNASVANVSGVVGGFTSTLSNQELIPHGIVVLAIGAESYRPEGEYLYQQNPNVLLSLDLDAEIIGETERLKNAQGVAFIQCVGSRIPERPYCSKVCCAHSVENAIKLKTMKPDREVSILYRDMRTYGERELLYQKARDLGVRFIRYSLADPPRVEEADSRLKITVVDQGLQKPVSLMADLLTLATAIVPSNNPKLAELYKVPLNAEGFFAEAHAKVKPVEASSDGIYLAGLCHYPKPVQESVAEALACASRASTILSKDFLPMSSLISTPVDENCDGCAFCVDACPFHAITLLEYMTGGEIKKTIEVNAIQCKGCGSCMATCPKQGVNVAGFTMAQLEAQVDAALGLI